MTHAEMLVSSIRCLSCTFLPTNVAAVEDYTRKLNVLWKGPFSIGCRGNIGGGVAIRADPLSSKDRGSPTGHARWIARPQPQSNAFVL